MDVMQDRVGIDVELLESVQCELEGLYVGLDWPPDEAARHSKAVHDIHNKATWNLVNDLEQHTSQLGTPERCKDPVPM
jgi:hypothetical protein